MAARSESAKLFCLVSSMNLCICLLVRNESKAAAQKTSVSVEAAILCSFATSALMSHASLVFLFAISTDNQSSILDDELSVV
jgi:hypothetical protein